MRKVYLFVASLFFVFVCYGQYSLTTPTYIQDFNTLANSGTTNTSMPDGWSFNESGSSASADGNYAAGTGSGSTGNTYSFGAAASSERALGELTSGTITCIFGFYFTNNTGNTINSLNISYTGETWRVGTADRSDRLDFQYSTTSSDLTSGTWIDQDALDYVNPGQAIGNGSLQQSSNISSIIVGLNILDGASLFIRWIPNDASGADDGLGIDDLTIEIPGQIVTPVELFSFAAKKDGAKNIIRWTTASENNNKGFEVQSSTDAIHYSTIAFVPSLANSGFSGHSLQYSFTDQNPSGIKQYYRLSQVDYDGRTKLSNIVLVKGDKPLKFAIGGLFPNPVTGRTLNVFVDAPQKDHITLVISDINGRILRQQIAHVEDGSNTISLDISSIGKGLYFVRLLSDANAETSVSKFIK